MRKFFPEQITTKRTTLRRIALEHAAGWKSFNNAIAKKMPWPIVPSVVYARNEILHYDGQWGKRFVYIVIEKSTGRIIGDFHLKSVGSRRAEFGHALHPDVWGTGITHEVLDAMAQQARRVGLRLWGQVEEENIRSWRSLEKRKAKFKGTRTLTVDGKRKRMRIYEL
jgi:RimJ/RimL family protein N-acetyltransferase